MSKLSWLAAALVLGVLFWLGSRTEHWRTAYPFERKSPDYSNAVQHGFIKGQLSLDIAPDPKLFSPDPAVRNQAHYLLDASIYRGKYYMYFGVVPVVLVFVPFHVLTGFDLPENAGVLLLISVGLGFQLAIFRRAKWRFFPRIGPILETFAVITLGLGSVAPVLVMRSAAYEVSIAGAYACLSAGWYFLFRAWFASARTAVYFAFASFALGLAVGARASTIVALLAFGAAGVRLLKRTRSRADWYRLLGATIVPAAIVGVGLMAYNYARFDSPIEFGFKYQQSELIYRGFRLTSPAFFWPNVRWYYFTPPLVSSYFPFFLQPYNLLRPEGYYGYEALYGQWFVMWAALSASLGFIWAVYRNPAVVPLAKYIAVLSGAFFLLFGCMCSFGFRADRYVADFQGTLILVVVLCGSVAVTAVARSWFVVCKRVLYVGFGTLIATFNVLIALDLLNDFAARHPSTFATLSYYGNYPSYVLYKMRLLHYGPVRCDVTFPKFTQYDIQPLVSAGAPGRVDALTGILVAPGQVEFDLVHGNYGALKGMVFPVTPGRKYSLQIDSGDFYPPRNHPYFAGWNPRDVEKLKNLYRISIDGSEYIKRSFITFDASPSFIYFGRNPNGDGKRFGGKITGIKRLPGRHPDDPIFRAAEGMWRLQFALPLIQGLNEPLLGSGYPRSNMLYIQSVDSGHVALNMDIGEYGAFNGPTIAVPAGRHIIDIVAGGQLIKTAGARLDLDPEKLKSLRSKLLVWIDGILAWNADLPAGVDSYDMVSVGTNTQGFSTCRPMFDAPLDDVNLDAAGKAEIISRVYQVLK